MIRRLPALTLLACLLSLAGQSACLGQAAPRPLDLQIIQAAALTDQQQEEVRAHAEYWCRQMTRPDASSAQIETARKELLRPLSSVVEASPTFRTTYGNLLVPCLQPVFSTPGRPHASLNAAIVLGELATRRSMDLLIEHADSRTQPSREMRIQASMNVSKALAKYGNNTNVIPARELGVAVRGVRNAAMRESDPWVLRYLLVGLQKVNNPEAQDALREVMDEVVKKIVAEVGVSPLIEPYYVTVVELRNSIITLPPAERTRLSLAYAPVLGRFLEHAAARWDEVHADAAMTQRCAGPIRATESLLKLSVESNNVQAPPTGLRPHWEGGNKQQFIDEVNRWLDVLRRPPFGR